MNESSRKQCLASQGLADLMNDNDDVFVGKLYNRRKEGFFGPHALLQSACAEGTELSAKTVRQFLKRVESVKSSFAELGIDQQTFDVIHQIAMLYVREADSALDLQRFSQTLNCLVSNSHLPKPHADDVVAYDNARVALGLAKTSDQWTTADWQMLGFMNDALLSQEAVRFPIERTPVFVADDDVGRVLWLAADRVPGPAMVTPHWWRIGLVPLGPKRELVTAIQQAMQSVIDGDDDDRHHIRWWIEEHPTGGGWFEEMGEADSAQIAAACIARALREPNVPHPILDPAAGVSAKLVTRAPTLDSSPIGEVTEPLLDKPAVAPRKTRDSRPIGEVTEPLLDEPAVAPRVTVDSTPIGKVTEVAKKTEAAKQAGINTFVLESNCAQETRSEWSDYTNDPDHPFAVQKVKTFGDAYEALLAISSHLQQAKTTCWQGWGTFIDEETPLDGELRGNRHEAETQQRYIDATKKQQ